MSRSTPRFPLTATVYPKLAPEAENALLVTGHLYRPGGFVLFLCTNADGEESERFECELTDEVAYGSTGKEAD